MTTSPAPAVLGLQPSFGFGDRLGTATPGHLAALREAGGSIRPIFAQQSIREMNRTGRTPADVMADAQSTLAEAGYDGPRGADADHLKTTDDVQATAAAGFTFFTIDPSDFVDPQADDYDAAAVSTNYAAIADEVAWTSQYRGKTVDVEAHNITFDELSVARAAVKYGRAIDHAKALAADIDAAMQTRGDYEIELSIDETPHPTTPAEHYIFADQLLAAGVKLVSLAPRFVGAFEKGIDFRGDLAELEASLHLHAAIARRLGPYKLSLHSGSDKLSMYAAFARATRGQFHVKTAGTSYLEALRVVARCDAGLFTRIIDFARDRFPTDRATYAISAELAHVPPASEIADAAKLEQHYLNEDPGRQILHVTYGSVLTHDDLGPAVRSILDAEPSLHADVLRQHFVSHLSALREGM